MITAQTRQTRTARADALRIVAGDGVVRIHETGRLGRRVDITAFGTLPALSSLEVTVTERGQRLVVSLMGPCAVDIDVPSRFPIRIDADGEAVVQTERLTGAVSAAVTGGAVLSIASVDAMEAMLADEAAMGIGALNGTAILNLIGAARVRIGEAAAGARLTATLRQSTRLQLDGSLLNLDLLALGEAEVDLSDAPTSYRVRRGPYACVKAAGANLPATIV